MDNDWKSVNEIFTLFEQELQQYDPKLLTAGLIGLGIFILELILYSKNIIFSSGEKRLKKAKELGHTIIAHRTFMNFEDRMNSSGHEERIWTATYEYEFKGKHGKKTIISHHGRPSSTMTLYHDGNSTKVYTESEMRQHKRTIFLLIIPIVIIIIVAKLLNYQP